MHAFDVLGDPVRRRIMELLADGERASGEIVRVIADEFGLTQPAVSYQLRILRVTACAAAGHGAFDEIAVANVHAQLQDVRRGGGVAA